MKHDLDFGLSRSFFAKKFLFTFNLDLKIWHFVYFDGMVIHAWSRTHYNKMSKKGVQIEGFLAKYLYEKWSLQTQKQSIFHQNPYTWKHLKVILFYIHLRAWARIIWQFYNQKEQFILLNRMTFFSKYDFRGQNTF